MTDARIEAAAKALCEPRHRDPDGWPLVGVTTYCGKCFTQAEDALAAADEVAEGDKGDIESLALMLFERSHEPPFPDSPEGMSEARSLARRIAAAFAAPPDRERLVGVTMKHLTEAHAYLSLRHNAETLTDKILAEFDVTLRGAGDLWEYGVRWGDDGTVKNYGSRDLAEERASEAYGDKILRRIAARTFPPGEWEEVPRD